MARLTQMHPRYLYRYRSLASPEQLERELQALTDSYIWCSDLQSLNDPMEGFFTLSSRMRRLPDAVQEIKVDGALVGVSSFTDTFESELMWAHYAGNYAGICVGYSAQKLLSTLSDNYTVVRVGYGDDPPEITSSEPSPAELKMLSFKKFSWAYEREWRVLGDIGKAEIGKDCIDKVYLGLRISENCETRICDALKGRDIRIWRMVLEPGRYKHEFEEL